VNTTSFNVVETHYDVLAESDKTLPLVLRHKNSVVCFFKIDRRYKESEKIFKNFLIYKLDQV
jgi:hypothetical protein